MVTTPWPINMKETHSFETSEAQKLVGLIGKVGNPAKIGRNSSRKPRWEMRGFGVDVVSPPF